MGIVEFKGARTLTHAVLVKVVLERCELTFDEAVGLARFWVEVERGNRGNVRVELRFNYLPTIDLLVYGDLAKLTNVKESAAGTLHENLSVIVEYAFRC